MSPRPAAGPLFQLRVLVTRPVEQAAGLAQALSAAGAIPVLYPTIRTAPPPSWELLDRAFGAGSTQPAPTYELVVFTSPTAVRQTLGRHPPSRLTDRTPRIAAVGRATAAALAAAGVRADLVPEDERQAGLASAVGALAPGTRVLFPQALDGLPGLRQALEQRGCIVDVVPVYQTLPIEGRLPPPPFDAATFMSPSALSAFTSGPGAHLLAEAVVAVIGPTTAKAAAELGIRVHVTAESPSPAVLVEALAAHYQGARP